MKPIHILLPFLLITILFSCKGVKQGKAFAACEFKLASLSGMQIAGVNVQGIQSIGDVNLIDAGKLTLAALQNGELPITFNLNVEVKNPNTNLAALNKLDWILLIDDNQITEGVLDQRVEVQPNGGVTNIPLLFKLDLKKIFTKDTGKSLLNLALNLINQGKEDSRISIKVRPSFNFLGKSISYPTYFKLSQEFKSK